MDPPPNLPCAPVKNIGVWQEQSRNRAKLKPFVSGALSGGVGTAAAGVQYVVTAVCDDAVMPACTVMLTGHFISFFQKISQNYESLLDKELYLYIIVEKVEKCRIEWKCTKIQ